MFPRLLVILSAAGRGQEQAEGVIEEKKTWLKEEVGTEEGKRSVARGLQWQSVTKNKRKFIMPVEI